MHLTSDIKGLTLRLFHDYLAKQPFSIVSLLDCALLSLTQDLQAPVAVCDPVCIVCELGANAQAPWASRYIKRSYSLATLPTRNYRLRAVSQKGTRQEAEERGNAHPWMLVAATVTQTTTQHDGGAKPTPRVQSSRIDTARAGTIPASRHIESALVAFACQGVLRVRRGSRE